MDQVLYQKALDFATLAHSGHLRDSGEPFVNHPINVAKTVESWGLDDSTIAAALLHDTVEDESVQENDLQIKFGAEITDLVMGETKISNLPKNATKQDELVYSLRKMIKIMARDLRVVLIKLADVLDNMRTIQYLSPDRQLRFSREVLDIYAPLADQMGMGALRSELEDLAFQFGYPAEFYSLLEEVKDRYQTMITQVAEFESNLTKVMETRIQNFLIDIKKKGIYSLYRKLQRPEINSDLGNVYDLVVARIMVDNIEDCYITLGRVHGKYHPIPYLGIRDYIANPRPNGYQSIHTNVFGPNGDIVEVQIRTHKMHNRAELGLVAERNKGELEWAKKLVLWQEDLANTEDFYNAVKQDAFQHKILVFSPKGSIYELPSGATPIDFAYEVHTEIGTQTTGAKVNGRKVNLDHKLNNGDVVEILLDRTQSKPNPTWLSFAVTTYAKREIAKAI